jgi:outer membrane receptor protein involved in Fe transport
MTFRVSGIAIAIGLTCFSSDKGCAQTTPPSSPAAQSVPTTSAGKRDFRPDFFAAYSPVSALDMVQRIPGFSISEGDGRRGFGENAGNVLIDGDRPSIKSDNIFTLLGRIPASQVERIELIEQAGADGDASGQGQIVNVIRKAGNAVSGTYDGTFQNGSRGGFTAFGSGSLTLRRGATSYELNASSFDERVKGRGPEQFFDVVNGARILNETRNYQAISRYTEFSIGGALKTQLGGTKVNLNGKALWNDAFDNRFGIYTLSSGAFGGDERLLGNEPQSDFQWETGGDVEFAILPRLTTKLIGLYRAERDNSSGSIEIRRPGVAASLFETRGRNRPSEAVLRIHNEWTGFARHTVQIGAELALNRLDSAFLSISDGNRPNPITSRANVLVRETRIEPFISDVWSVSPSWRIESGAIFEFSTLRLSGDTNGRRQFRFVKPRITATWTVDKATTLELKANQQVAQLDFNEFATSIDLGQGNQIDSGSRDLVPEKVTTVAALIRHKFFDRGSIQLEASFEKIRDTQDLVPIADGQGGFFDGTGNIGSSRRWNAELDITLPLDWITKGLGLSGLEVKYVGHYHGSEVTDPVTFLKRPMSFRPKWHQNWELRHDIAKAGIAWGINVAAAAPQKAYFVSLFRQEYSSPDAEIFVEYKKWKYGTVRLRVIDFPQDKFQRTRFVYTSDRRTGFVSEIIERDRAIDPRIQLTLSGKF